MRSLLLVAAVGAAALVAGCGGSNKLSEGDANSLQADKETLADDVQAIVSIDGNKAEAKRLVRSVEKTIVLYERFRKIGESVGRAPGAVGGRDQLRGVEAHAVIGAGQARDRLLHQRAPEVVDAPAKRLGGGVQPHLDPAGLDAAHRLAQGQAERRGVLEVLLARDLLDAVGPAQQGVEGNERQGD